MRIIGCLLLGFACVWSVVDEPLIEAKKSQVAAVLDDWHNAAARSDALQYFKHLSEDTVFLGTDAKERWTLEEFRAFAKPYFDKGKGWRFRATQRNVNISKDGQFAWFDEILDTAELGTCRGSGVLLFVGSEWKIAQYNLSVPIPNEVFAEVRQVIEAASKEKR